MLDLPEQVLSITHSEETGGGHGQKGVDFQRYWAIRRIFELEEADVQDFLLLFESVQDILELDSVDSPTSALVYQIKKKDRGEWTWTALTGLPEPGKKKRLKKTTEPSSSEQQVQQIQKDQLDSPLGKLGRSILAFQVASTQGVFVSNAGCDVPLSDAGETAASAMNCRLSQLSQEHVSLLTNQFVAFRKDDGAILSLDRISVQKCALNPDDADTYLVGIANLFLTSRSPKHAAQAKSLIEALFSIVSSRGRKTALCDSFEQLKKQRGFSRNEFRQALQQLQAVPDRDAIQEVWLHQLSVEGLNIVATTKLRVELAILARQRVFGEILENDLSAAADIWVKSNPPGTSVRLFLESGHLSLRNRFPRTQRETIYAHLVSQGVELCMVPSSEN